MSIHTQKTRIDPSFRPVKRPLPKTHIERVVETRRKEQERLERDNNTKLMLGYVLPNLVASVALIVCLVTGQERNFALISTLSSGLGGLVFGIGAIMLHKKQ
jgi:hypothetical protein